MAIRIINTTLLVITLIGIVFAYRAGKEHRQLLAEQTQLEAELGQMPIADPSKIYVLALETGEELHFAWRVYVPAKVRLTWQHRDGGGSSSRSPSASNEPIQGVVRVRVREKDKDGLLAFTKEIDGSATYRIAERELAELLSDHWDRIRVEQLGKDGVEAINLDQVGTLLRLTLPDDLKTECAKNGDESMNRRLQNVLFEVSFGTESAWRQKETESEVSDAP